MTGGVIWVLCMLDELIRHKEMLPGYAGHYNLSESGEYTRAMP